MAEEGEHEMGQGGERLGGGDNTREESKGEGIEEGEGTVIYEEEEEVGRNIAKRVRLR